VKIVREYDVTNIEDAKDNEEGGAASFLFSSPHTKEAERKRSSLPRSMPKVC